MSYMFYTVSKRLSCACNEKNCLIHFLQCQEVSCQALAKLIADRQKKQEELKQIFDPAMMSDYMHMCRNVPRPGYRG